MRSIECLTPQPEVNGELLIMLTPEIAGVLMSVLGRQVGSLDERRRAIIEALDVLVTGV